MILDTIQESNREIKEKQEREEQVVEQVNEILEAPTEEVLEGQMSIEDFQEEIFETAFKVRGTALQLRELKMFLENGGFEYESITD